MNTIIPNNHSDRQFNFTINRFFKDHKIGSIIKQCNFGKQKGFSCIKIFQFIFMLVFTGKNLFRTIESEQGTEFSKDVVYRFLNSPNFNWRKFLLLLSSSIIKNIIVPLTSKDRVNILVVDDSLYSRNRSKSVELLARVRHHVEHRYVKGFRMLTLGWSDGNTFLPLAFTLLSSEKKENRLCSENQAIDKRTNGAKLRKEAVLKSPAAMIELLLNMEFQHLMSFLIVGSHILKLL